jgi:hypothetical protein
MFATFYADGQRLGKARVSKEIQPALAYALPVRPYTSHGIAGLKLGDQYRLDAAGVRRAFIALRHFIDNTGYGAKLETTANEARALMAGGLVSTGSGTYRLEIREGRVAILSGHGKVS